MSDLKTLYQGLIKTTLLFFLRKKSDLFHTGEGGLTSFRLRAVVTTLFLCGFLSSIEAGPSKKVRDPRLRSTAVIVQDQNTDEFLLKKEHRLSCLLLLLRS